MLKLDHESSIPLRAQVEQLLRELVRQPGEEVRVRLEREVPVEQDVHTAGFHGPRRALRGALLPGHDRVEDGGQRHQEHERGQAVLEAGMGLQARRDLAEAPGWRRRCYPTSAPPGGSDELLPLNVVTWTAAS